MRIVVLLSIAAAVASCTPALTNDQIRELNSRPLYTCCNIRYESEAISDANYLVGTLLPLGTPVQVQSAGRGSITFVAEGRPLTLYHEYGTGEESHQRYFEKVLVRVDPKAKLVNLPRQVRDAIVAGRLAKGMTRDDVVLSFGHPPTHRTPSLSSPQWIYWRNRWASFSVVEGKVMDADWGLSGIPTAE
jgi:hypothetical protein